MAEIKDITTGKQTVSSAGAVTGTLDTSAMSGDFTIKVRVPKLAAGKKVIIALEDTAHATPFSDAIQQAIWQAAGPIVPEAEKVFSIKSHDLPKVRFGATNTKLRFNVTAADASPAMEIHGWLEQ